MARYQIVTWKTVLEVHEPPGQSMTCPEEVARIARAVYSGLEPDQEHFAVFVLNQKNKVTGFKVVFTGGLAVAAVDLKVLFRHLLLSGAAAFAVVHNHPSGDPAPSLEDISLTRLIKAASENLGLRFLEHVVLADGTNRYYSFSDNGLI